MISALANCLCLECNIYTIAELVLILAEILRRNVADGCFVRLEIITAVLVPCQLLRVCIAVNICDVFAAIERIIAYACNVGKNCY